MNSINEKNKKQVLNHESIFQTLSESREKIIQTSRENFKEFFKFLELSNQNTLSQNARLLRAYEAIKDELDKEKKLRRICLNEREKNEKQLKDITKELNSKQIDLDKITKKYQELEEIFICLRNSKEEFKDLKKNWNAAKRVKFRENDVLKEVSRIFEEKENLLHDFKRELDEDEEKINEKLEFYKKEHFVSDICCEIEKCFEVLEEKNEKPPTEIKNNYLTIHVFF